MAALKDKYHGTACLEYASVGSVWLLIIGLAGLNLWLIHVAEREYTALWGENFACV